MDNVTSSNGVFNLRGQYEMETFANYKPTVQIASDPESLAKQGVELFITDAEKVIKAKGAFHVAISGGHTPRRFYELLGELPRIKALSWHNIHLFWVDEHCSGVDGSGRVNYELAADTFLPKVDIPAENIHDICHECHRDCGRAARLYEQTIRDVFDVGPGEVPQFDLIILGMGADGHTGSLFPNSYATFEHEGLACIVYFMDGKSNRITMTRSILCAASHLAILVSGDEKAHALKDILTTEPDEVLYPIHILWPILDKVTWLVDTDAAQFL